MNFAVAQPEILKEFPDWSAAKIGMIPSIYAIFYAAGQFINGNLGDILGARIMMTSAILVASLTNMFFSSASSFPAMLALWGINGYAQSAGWPILVKTMSNWTGVKRRGIVIGLISTCYQVGNVLSWLLAGMLWENYGWRAVFWVPGLTLIPVAVLFVIFIRNKPEDAGFSPVRDDLQMEAAKSEESPVQADLSLAQILKLTLSNRILWILGIGYFCMNSVRYAFMNWSVQYMADFHGRSIKGSAFTAVALPLIGSVGAVSAGFFSDKLFGGRRAPVCAMMLLGLASICVIFVFIPQGQWILATAMLGLAGFMVYGPDMLMSGAASVDFSHPKTASAATGFTMMMGATGAIFSGAGVGWLKDRASGAWSLTFYVLAFLAVVSALLMVSLWNERPKGRIQES
jgi:sugar phosphate permease